MRQPPLRAEAAVGQKYVPKVEPWYMERWTKMRGPPGLIFTHTQAERQQQFSESVGPAPVVAPAASGVLATASGGSAPAPSA